MDSSFVLWKFMCHLREDGIFDKCKSDTNVAQGIIKLLTERKIYGLCTLSYYKNKNFTYSQAQEKENRTLDFTWMIPVVPLKMTAYKT